MNRWTIPQLSEVDNLTFAMCILSERAAGLNPEAPLARKIHEARKVLEALRDDHWQRPELDAREAIWRAVERENAIDDIKTHLGLSDDGEQDHADLHGMTPEDVFADKEIMDRIIERLDDSEIGQDWWFAVEASIEDGISDVLEKRKEQQA